LPYTLLYMRHRKGERSSQ